MSSLGMTETALRRKRLAQEEEQRLQKLAYMKKHKLGNFKNPICQECIRYYEEKKGGHNIDCIGIPMGLDWIHPKIRETMTDEELNEALILKDPVRWLKAYFGWEAYDYQALTLRCTARRKVLRFGRRCLVGDTPILMSDGSFKNIKDIKKGDYVVSKNFKKGVLVSKKVINVFDNGEQEVFEIKLSNGLKIIATDNHPFLHSITKKWITIESGELAVGTVIDTIDSPQVVINIKNFGIKKTYDIEIEDTHNFIANSIICHNSGKSSLMAGSILHGLITQDGVPLKDGEKRGCHILLVSPYDGQVELIFSMIEEFLNMNAEIANTVVRHRRSPHQFEFSNGSTILGKSAGTKSGSEGVTIRGQAADRIYMDECIAKGSLVSNTKYAVKKIETLTLEDTVFGGGKERFKKGNIEVLSKRLADTLILTTPISSIRVTSNHPIFDGESNDIIAKDAEVTVVSAYYRKLNFLSSYYVAARLLPLIDNSCNDKLKDIKQYNQILNDLEFCNNDVKYLTFSQICETTNNDLKYEFLSTLFSLYATPIDNISKTVILNLQECIYDFKDIVKLLNSVNLDFDIVDKFVIKLNSVDLFVDKIGYSYSIDKRISLNKYKLWRKFKTNNETLNEIFEQYKYNNDNEFLLLPIISKRKYKTEYVYNLKSTADSRYFANGMLTHNCDYLSEGDFGTVLPIMTDHAHTRLMVSSTPTGKRQRFYAMCHDSHYKEFYVPSQRRPNWNAQMEEEARADSPTELHYIHEILAEFGEAESGVFPTKYLQQALAEYTYLDDEHNQSVFRYKPDSKWIYIIGVDQNEVAGTYAIVVGWNPEDHKFYVVDNKGVPKSEFTQMSGMELVIKLNAFWSPDFIFIDKRPSSTAYEVLKRHGMEMRSKYGNKSPDSRLAYILKEIDFGSKMELPDLTGKKVKRAVKHFLVGNAVRRFEEGRVCFPRYDKMLFQQLADYSLKVSPAGNTIYEKGPKGDHMVDALMLALMGFSLQYSELGIGRVATGLAIGPLFGNKEVLTDEERPLVKRAVYFIDNKKSYGNINNRRHVAKAYNNMRRQKYNTILFTEHNNIGGGRNARIKTNLRRK